MSKAMPNNGLDKNRRQWPKGNARAMCQKNARITFVAVCLFYLKDVRELA